MTAVFILCCILAIVVLAITITFRGFRRRYLILAKEWYDAELKRGTHLMPWYKLPLDARHQIAATFKGTDREGLALRWPLLHRLIDAEETKEETQLTQPTP